MKSDGAIIPRPLLEPIEGAIATVTNNLTGLEALDPTQCAPLSAVLIPGTTDTNRVRDPHDPIGVVVADIGRQLKEQLGDGVSTVWVPYKSDAVITSSYKRSREDGVAATHTVLREIKSACPSTKFALIGFSQGSDIVSNVAADISDGEATVTADEVSSIVAVANPRRGAEAAKRYGTASADTIGFFGAAPRGWGVLADRVIDICNDGDHWCSADPRVKPLKNTFEQFSLNPKDAQSSAKAVHEALRNQDSFSDDTRAGLSSFLKFLLGGVKTHLSYGEAVGGMRPGNDVAVEWVVNHAR